MYEWIKMKVFDRRNPLTPPVSTLSINQHIKSYSNYTVCISICMEYAVDEVYEWLNVICLYGVHKYQDECW